jgi:hypothetical protein
VNGPSFSHDGGIHEVPLPSTPGRLWLCGKHRIGPDPDALLLDTGADTVVCLTEAYELSARYPSYVAWLLEQVRLDRAVWFPIHDLGVADRRAFDAFLDDLLSRLDEGAGLVVHCAAGIGRSGTTAVALCVRLGMPLDEALAHVRRHRPMAGPEVGAQLDLVRSIERR